MPAMQPAGERDVEILVHIAAPGAARDDDAYRTLATDYLAFLPSTRRTIYERRDRQEHDVSKDSLLPLLDDRRSTKRPREVQAIMHDSQAGDGRGSQTADRNDRLGAGEPVWTRRTTVDTQELASADTPPSSDREENDINTSSRNSQKFGFHLRRDALDITESPFLSFRSVADNLASPKFAVKAHHAQVPSTPPEIASGAEMQDSQISGSRVSDSQRQSPSSNSIISEIPDSNPNDVLMPELNSPSRVMEHFLTTIMRSKSKPPRSQAGPASYENGNRQQPRGQLEARRRKLNSTRIEKTETVLVPGAKEKDTCKTSEKETPSSLTTPVAGDGVEVSTVLEAPRMEEAASEDERDQNETRPTEVSVVNKRAETQTETGAPPTPSSMSRKRTRRQLGTGASGLISDFSDSPTHPAPISVWSSGDINEGGQKKRVRLETERLGPQISRADSEPLPNRRQASEVARTVALTRSVSDQFPQRTQAPELQVQFFSALEICPPEPTPSLNNIEPSSLVTSNLAKLAADLDLDKRYRPGPQSRTLRPFERGYWLLDCDGWDEKLRHAAWVFLSNWVGSGLAGWGTRCWRDEKHSWMRLYCFGQVAGHTYLLLYLASCRRVKYTNVNWISGGDVAVTALARS